MISDQRKKEIFSQVDNRLLAGESSKAVFEAYSHEFSDREPLARKILEFVPPPIAEKYKGLNLMLVLGMGYFAAEKLLASIPLLKSIHPFAILFSVFIPTLNYFFIYAILKRKRWAYNLTGIFTLIALSRFMTQTSPAVLEHLWSLIDFFSMIIVAVLAFYLQNKMFAKQGVLGPRKDRLGNYIFPN